MRLRALFGLTLGVLAYAGTAAAAPDNPAAIARAQAHVRQNAANTFFGPDQALVAEDTLSDADGTEHVRFSRRYRGLRVIGGDLVIHGSDTGAFIGVSQTLAAPLALGTTASLSAQGAARQAITAFTGRPAASRAGAGRLRPRRADARLRGGDRG